jgi:thiol-disulfide isomerase/thioredoxin
MAQTPSTMLPLDTVAPDFSLPDVATGAPVSLADVATAKGTLVMFLSAHCPFVKHVEQELGRIGREYGPRGIGIVAISANDAVTYPADAPAGLARQAVASGFTFPYLYDESQATARAYDAACTPDFFLFGPTRRLVYRGQLDDSRPSNGKPVTGVDLRAALDAVLAGRPVSSEQYPSIGCNIKWRADSAAIAGHAAG